MYKNILILPDISLLIARDPALLCCYHSTLMDCARVACRFIYKFTCTSLCTAVESTVACYSILLRAVGPEHDNGPPSNHLVVWSLLAFWLFLLLGGLALKYPTANFRICFTVLSCCLTIVLTFCVTNDFIRGTHGAIRSPRTRLTAMFFSKLKAVIDETSETRSSS